MTDDERNTYVGAAFLVGVLLGLVVGLVVGLVLAALL